MSLQFALRMVRSRSSDFALASAIVGYSAQTSSTTRKLERGPSSGVAAHNSECSWSFAPTALSWPACLRSCPQWFLWSPSGFGVGLSGTGAAGSETSGGCSPSATAWPSVAWSRRPVAAQNLARTDGDPKGGPGRLTALANDANHVRVFFASGNIICADTSSAGRSPADRDRALMVGKNGAKRRESYGCLRSG